MDQKLDVVRGRRIIVICGSELREVALAAPRVVVDLGTGDGRWVYRLARSHPAWRCIGLDANAEGMREFSWRAAKKPRRGGAPNVWFIRAAVESLPAVLRGIADEIHVQYPWAKLRRMLLLPDEDGLASIARIGKSGASFRITLNLLSDDIEHGAARTARLAHVYARAGLQVDTLDIRLASPQTSWAKRLAHGRLTPVLVIEGRVDRQSENHRYNETGIWAGSSTGRAADS